jgi:hypothetical protein
MDVLLIKDGKVENCICADSVSRAQQFYPDHICIERTDALRGFGPGDLYDGTNFSKAPYVRVIVPVTRLEFLRRFTPEQRIAIRASTDPMVIDGRELLDMASDVSADDPDTILYVRYLQQQGFISAEDADRILEVSQ